MAIAAHLCRNLPDVLPRSAESCDESPVGCERLRKCEVGVTRETLRWTESAAVVAMVRQASGRRPLGKSRLGPLERGAEVKGLR